MVTAVTAVTVLVLTGNVFVVAPAATVTETGTVAAALLLVSVTIAPPAGAALLSVTVPVLLTLPVTAVGFTLTPFKAARKSVVKGTSLALRRWVAVRVTAVTGVTVLVVAANVFVVAPAATVTETGTVAAVLLLVSVTIAPPAGAALLSVTVPVLLTLPVTAVGFTLTPFKAAGGFTVSVAVLATPL